MFILGGLAVASAINAAELIEELPENEETEITENLTLFQKMRKVKMFAWMLFIGDALENIADGMAMGAAFQGVNSVLPSFITYISMSFQ